MKRHEDNSTDIKTQSALVNALLTQFLQTHSRKDFLENCLQYIKNWAQISCAGIRVLDAQGNIPYQAVSGFSAELVESENWLSTHHDQCACVRVVQGKIEPQDASQITSGGSFCCNNTQSYHASLTGSEKARFRGVCIVNGYSSVAVIPISYRQNILGALHLVDIREGAFTPAKIKFLETSVASVIGEGIYRYNVEDRLERNLETQTVLTSLLKDSLEDLTLDNILNLTLNLIHTHKPFARRIRSAIYLSESDPDKMLLRVSLNDSQEALAHCAQIQPGDCACGKAAERDVIVFSAGDTDCKSGERHYSVPIQYQKNTIGVICVYLADDHRRDESEEQFLNAVANTLAGIVWRKRSESMLRSLSLRMVNVQEEERRAIALELHDQIGQMLTGLKLMIGRSLRSSEKTRLEVLAEAQKVVTELIGNVREMSLNLRPSMLDDLGLLPALIWHFQRCKNQSNLSVDFRHSGLEVHVSKDLAIAAYRIVQEALTNVIRYAGVNEVLVEIWIDQSWLYIRIEDKGKGFRIQTITPGSSIGLQSMRERAVLLGGTLTVDSLPGQGTVIFAQLPLNSPAENVTIPAS